MLWSRYCSIVLNGTRGGSFVLPWLEFIPQCADVGRWDRTIAVWSLTNLWRIVGGITLRGTDVAVMRPQVVLIKDHHKIQQS